MNKKIFQRLAIILFGLAFVGSTAIAIIPGLFEKKTGTNSDPNTDPSSLEKQLQDQIRGYQKVLAREPKNPTALSGLVSIYVQSGNTAKAIPSLEKLVEYYPERTEFKSYLELAKQQLAAEQKSKSEAKSKQ
jgi:tetratricopeptide (TPR) repeat protein